MAQAQSPISETPPITAIDPPQPPENLKPSDFVRISKRYPQFKQYIQQTIARYQQFHPNGTLIEGISEQERAKWWGAASVIVKEFSALEAHLASEFRAIKAQTKEE